MAEPNYYAQGLWQPEPLWASFAAAAAGAGRDAYVQDEAERIALPALLDRALRIAGALRGSGIEAGETILVQSRNSIDAYASLLAGISQGIIAVPLPPMFSAQQLLAVVQSGKASALLQLDNGGGALAAGVLRDAPDLKLAYTVDALPEDSDPRLRPWASALAASPVSAVPAGPDADTLVLYSSGSTGAPKGVVQTGNSLRFAATALAGLHRVTRHDTVLVALEFGFVGGTVLGALLAFLSGANTVLLRRWDAARALELIETHRCSYTLLMPTHCYDIVNAPELDARDCSSLTRAIMAGATTEQRQQAEGRFCGIALPMYGMSESMAHCTCGLDASPAARHTSDGSPLPGVEMKLLGEGDAVVGPGEVGQIYLRGPNRLRRYRARPELTAEVIDAEGWFNTGDRVQLTDEGCIRFLGRASEIIRRGGVMIQPAEVEAAFRGLEGVIEVAVVGLPDPRLGEKACACILTKTADQAPDIERMRQHLEAAGLPRYQWPEYLLAFDEFPRTPSLKVRRADLVAIARSRTSELSPA